MNAEVLVQALDMLAFVLVTPEFLGEERLKEVRVALENVISNIKEEEKEAYELGKDLYNSGKTIFETAKEKSLDELMYQMTGPVRRVVNWLTAYTSTNIKGMVFETFAKLNAIGAFLEDTIKGRIAPKIILPVFNGLMLIVVLLARLFANRGRLFALGCVSFVLARSVAIWLAA